MGMNRSGSLMEGKVIKNGRLDGDQAGAMANYKSPEYPTGAEKSR